MGGPGNTLHSFFFLMFIYFERKREHEQGKGREREGERERTPSRLHGVSTEPHARLSLTNCEIVT